MEAQKAVYALCDHFLGKDWYIVDPVSTDTANDIVVDQIISRFPGVPNDPVSKWRSKHKRCKWCTHVRIHHGIDVSGIMSPYYVCSAKDKVVNENLPRPLCTVFNLDTKT